MKACHASGKTFGASTLVPWWLQRWEGAKVITTAPTMRQVKLLWEEVRSHVLRARMKFPLPSTTALRLNDREYAIGMSSAHGVNAQGFHGEKVLIIADEAPGIDEQIWDAIEGIRAGGDVHLVELGNPVVPSGHFFENFAAGRSTCDTYTISAFDTPNFFNPAEGRPYTIDELLAMNEDQINSRVSKFLVSRSWVRERFHRWGADNPKYLARALGIFPSRSEWSVFDIAWIEAAKREPSEAELAAAKGHLIQVGLDVAGSGGDETAATARVDGIIIDRAAWAQADPRGAVVSWLGKLRTHPLYALGPVVVDVVGIGYNFALHLADQGFQVFAFNAGSGAIDPQYVNSKAEVYFQSREYFKQGLISGLNDEHTEAQLSDVQWRPTPTGKTEVESKEQMRKRRGTQSNWSSPDRAEALIMAFMRVVPQHQVVPGGIERVVIGRY